MAESLTALASENLNPSLRSLLEDVQRGYIRVPRFQRPFVWTDSQRLELLRSIRDNMPIGSLLVWRTAKFKLASFQNVGPHIIPSISDIAPATGWQYLLDGHQRVSTLIGLLLQSSEEEIPSIDGESIEWNIQYDLLAQDFVFAKKATRKGAVRPLLPLWSLLDGRLVNKQMREIRKRAEDEGWSEVELEAWEERADQLAYRFQQCRTPIVVMTSDDLELAARTFQRINSLGTPMGEAHLVAALTWRADFDLREHLDQLKQTFPVGWRNVDEGFFLQVCKGLVGLDMTKAGQTELVKKLKDDPKILDRAGTALKRALNWLSQLGVLHEELLPYAFQVILLAVEIDRSKADAIPGDVFTRWFWRTSWSEIFATAAFREVRAEQEVLQKAVDSGVGMEWTREPLPTRFDFRSARVRLFVLRLAKRAGLTGEAAQTMDGHALLAKHGRDALMRLFPIPRSASQDLKGLLQGVGNRFLVDPDGGLVLKDRLKHGPELPGDVLSAHFIDAEGLRALRSGDLETFIKRRAAAMEQWDKAEWEAIRLSEIA